MRVGGVGVRQRIGLVQRGGLGVRERIGCGIGVGQRHGDGQLLGVIGQWDGVGGRVRLRLGERQRVRQWQRVGERERYGLLTRSHPGVRPPAATAADRPAVGRRRLVAAVTVAVVIAAVAASAGVPTRATYGARTTADEPQYLLTAISLAADGDLDIADELEAERWRAFHEAELPQQTRPLADGRRISPHDALLPILLVPGVALGGWVGAKLTLVLVAGATAGLLVWTAVRRLGVRPGVAGLVAAVSSASVPLAPYGSQVYPELPAALAVLVAVAALLAPLRAAGLVAVAVACVALPWLGVKYAPVAAALAVLVAVRLVRARRAGTAGAFLAALAVAAICYLAVHRAVWTGWTVYASADHFVDSGEVGVVGFTPDYAGRALRLSGLLLDRAFGIAAWQPAWLVAVPGLAALLRARPRWWPALTVPLAVGWLVATFVALTMAGWWFPGRQIVVVVPLLVLVIAWWLDGYPAGLWVFSVAGIIGVANWLILSVEASTGRRTLVVDFFDSANPLYQSWAAVLPDYMGTGTIPWAPHSVWLLLLTALAFGGWRTGRLRRGPPARLEPRDA